MATDDTRTPDPSERFGWSGTGGIRMLDSDGNPLAPDVVEAINADLAYKAWAAANPEEAAEDDED